MAKVYGPTQEAENNPRRVYLKKSRKWVGVGGPIEITRKAPKRNSSIPEATPEQYKFLYEERKMTNLVTDLNADDATAGDLQGGNQ